MGFPTVDELEEQIFYLGFMNEGFGLGYGYEEVLRMAPARRHRFIQRLSERYKKIQEAYEEAAAKSKKGRK